LPSLITRVRRQWYRRRLFIPTSSNVAATTPVTFGGLEVAATAEFSGVGVNYNSAAVVSFASFLIEAQSLAAAYYEITQADVIFGGLRVIANSHGTIYTGTTDLTFGGLEAAAVMDSELPDFLASAAITFGGLEAATTATFTPATYAGSIAATFPSFDASAGGTAPEDPLFITGELIQQQIEEDILANEAQILSSLTIRKGNLVYQSQPVSFSADVDGTDGPTPGAVSVSYVGTVIDLSELTTPGFCRMVNIDDNYIVDVGIYDGVSKFYPMIELRPGEPTVVRLSRYLGEEAGPGTGTGTTGAGINQLMMRTRVADTDTVVIVDAFEA